jgi:hypothetical protein
MPEYPAAAAAQTMNRLGWCIDRRDWDGVSAILAGEVTLDYTDVFGGDPATSTGVEVVEQWRGMLGALAATQHVITGVEVAAQEATSVHITANVVATHVGGPDVGGQLWTIGGWYEATLDEGQILSALTLHPLWETGTREILGLG